MNIQKIYNAKLNTMPLTSRTDIRSPQYGIRITAPLSVDTVSFQSKGTLKTAAKDLAAAARQKARELRDAKLLAEAKTAPTKKELLGEERTWGVPKSTATQIHNQILKPQNQIHNFMHRVFDDLVKTEDAPNNLILKISDRPKTDISIMEKSATRKWNSAQEIFDNMTDLNGAKIVLNYKTGKADAEKVLDRFIPLIKTKQVKLKEIELQRPGAIEGKKKQEEYDYVSKAFLDKLEEAQEEVTNGSKTDVSEIELVDRPLPKYTKGNYCALHLILELPEKDTRPFELQIMGPRVSDGKAFDDKRFKFFDGKELDKMYAPLVSLWKGLMPSENKAAKERFLTYCKDALLQLIEDEIYEAKNHRLIRPQSTFITVRNYGLTPEYDINYQYKLLRKCEQDAEKEKEKLKKAKPESVLKTIEEKVETKIVAVEKRVIDAKEITKEALQKLVAKYTPKHKSGNGRGPKAKH